MVMFLWHTGISSVPIEIVSYKIFTYCPALTQFKPIALVPETGNPRNFTTLSLEKIIYNYNSM